MVEAILEFLNLCFILLLTFFHLLPFVLFDEFRVCPYIFELM